MTGLRYPWRYALYMAAYYGTTAIYQSYAPKYYQEMGVGGAALTMLLACSPLVSLASQPFFGVVGDRARVRVRVLRVCALCAAVLAVLMSASSSVVWLLAVSTAFAFFFTSIQPMGDSIVLEKLDERGHPFGPLRLTGCLTFAVLNLVYGRVLQNGYTPVPFITGGMLLLVCASSLLLPRTPGHQKVGAPVRLREVFKAPEMARLMVLVTILQCAMGYFYSYFSIYFTALPGGTPQLLGVAYFMSAVSETPFLLFSDRLFHRFGTGKLMLLSALLLTVRFTLLAATQSVVVALISQLCHGGGFIVITVTMARYISAVMPPELKTAGQTILSALGFAVARVVGILGGGLLSGAMGVRGVFYVTAALCALAFVLFAPRYLRAAPLNGESTRA